MKKYTLIISALLLVCNTVVSCKKEGLGGKCSLSGTVKHHAFPIPNATVYIKYGAIEFPGNDVTQYDASFTTDATAHYEFKDLQKGNYYLYGVGYDSAYMQAVVGGVYIKLRQREAKTSDVPVTE